MKATEERLVPASPSEAFRHLVTLDSLLSFLPGAYRAVHTSDGPFGVGSTFRVWYRDQGREHVADMCVTSFNPARTLSIQALLGMGRVQCLFTLHPAGSDTRIVCRRSLPEAAAPSSWWHRLARTMQPSATPPLQASSCA